MFPPNFGRGQTFDPWHELNRLQEELNRLFVGARAEFPYVNLYSNDQGCVLTADLPGVDPEVLDVSVLAESVTLKGKVVESEVAGATQHRRERFTGEFNRTIQLPLRVDPDRAEAQFKHGALTLTVPRAEGAKARKIDVRE